MNILTLPEELSGITKLSIEYKNSGKTEQLELQ
jgi:hypothetical protein